MASVTRLTDRHFLNTIAKFPAEIRDDPTNRVFYLSLAIVRHFLGARWADDHIQDNGQPGYLRLNWNDRKQIQEQSFRIVDLAEILFNLQHVYGFDDCIKRMQEGDIEGTYAELDLGRMRYLSLMTFRFVIPSGRKGDDFDIEIILANDLVVSADAKCKVETTKYSDNTVLHSLQHARGQFPKDRPSIIFVKVPPRWLLASDDVKPKLTNIANRFLRGTGRIVSVKFYSSFIYWADGAVTHTQAFHEINNPFNRFDPSRNWDMFTERDGEASPNAIGEFSDVPKSWRRLLYYPEGLDR